MKYGALPNSGGKSLDKSGVDNSSYIVKKGTPSGEGAKFNRLPPGQDITNQEVADIRDLPLKSVTASGYPGDGWEGS